FLVENNIFILCRQLLSSILSLKNLLNLLIIHDKFNMNFNYSFNIEAFIT
ncbi:hypothetical protein EZS27_014459, partial [termite gut metagenome]